MAERGYNGRELVQNPNMIGSGSTTSENAWVGDAAYLWRVAQTTSGNNVLAEFTSFEGRNCLKFEVNSLTRTGATTGQLYVGNLAEYAGGTINAANLETYGFKIRPGYSYALSVTYKLASITADTGSTVFFGAATFYNTNGTRNAATPSNVFNVTTAGDWTTGTGTFTTKQSGMSHIGLRIGFSAQSDPTTNGQGTVYISQISLTEVLPARATATSRATATNRVAVRDMGTALSFDGVDDYVRVATPLAHVVQGNAMTFAFYFKTNDTADGTIFGNRIDDSTGNLHFGWRAASARIEGAFFATGSIYTGRFASPRLAKNQWYHVCIVYDGTTLNTGTNGVDIYIDNVLCPKVSTNFGGAGSGFNFTLGGQTNAASANWLACKLEEFRTWSRALTADERTALFLYGEAPRSGLKDEYLFNEASGSVALDTSGNGNNGTITGATYTTDTPKRARTDV